MRMRMLGLAILAISTQRIEKVKLVIGGVHYAETRQIGVVFAL